MESILPIIVVTQSPSNFPLDLTSAAQTHHLTTGIWSELPVNFLYGLIKYLDISTDIPHLRAVCHSWRSKLSLSLLPSYSIGFGSIPKLNFKTTLPGSGYLLASHFYLISPVNGGHCYSPWLVRIQGIATQKWRLFNPVNSSDPYFLSTPRLSSEISLLDHRVLELSSPFSLISSGNKSKVLSKKVVGGWNYLAPTNLNVFAVLILLEEEFGGGLLFMKLGDLEWGKIEKDDDNICNSLNIADIAFFKDDFYVFEMNTWHVGIIDPSDCDFNESPEMDFIDAPELDFGVSMSDVGGVYFVPAKDDLYLVFEVFEEIDFKEKLMIFMLDENEWEWKRVTNIGDNVFFIGSDVSFAVSAERLPGGWKSGTVCLFDRTCKRFIDQHVKALGDEMPEGAECMDSITYPKYWKLFRMFDIDDEEKSVVPLEDLDDKEAYTKLFFPPPPWMKWHSPSLDDVAVQLHNLKFTDADDNHGTRNVAAGGADLLEEIP
ncbi:F-box protein At2g17036-like [Chenopodium quinoa]|uniref:F-box protein At2g17036-like n=1 Tax=Chenopodium quinoa TaxID=63459 RepID=UPI000B78A50C|nr:F-box protein At2g17036-like [Chenopodium quinoa]